MTRKQLEIERLKLLNKAFRAIPGCPRQLKIRAEINRVEALLATCRD